jgi:predicted alpha/beta-hydrolase family hydrolase
VISVPLNPDGWDGEVAVILAHGAGQGMNSPFMSFFHQELAARGYLSVKFEFGYMEAKRKVPDPQAKLQERYREVIREVETEFKPKRLVIGGKSMGGRVASYIAGEIPQVAGLVFLGYPLHPPGKPSQLRDEHLYTLYRPMLFISGTRDTLAQQELLQRVVNRIGNRARLVWIDGGDHSLKVRRNDQTSLVTAVDSIDQWIRRECAHLPGQQERTSERRTP